MFFINIKFFFNKFFALARQIPLINDARRNLTANLFSKCVFLSAFICSAKTMGPSDYGVWAALSVLISYSAYVNLGVGHVMLRDISAKRALHQGNCIDLIKNRSWTVFFILAVLGSILFFVVVLKTIPDVVHFNKNLMAGVMAIIFLQQLFHYMIYYWSGSDNFRAVSRLQIFFAMVSGGVISFVVPFMGLEALVLGFVAGYVISMPCLYFQFPFSLKWEWNWKFAQNSIKEGFPFVFVGLGIALFQTIDRVLVFKILGRESMGYYSVAGTVSDLLLVIALSMVQVLYPRMVAVYVVDRTGRQLQRLLALSFLFLAYGMIFLFLFVFVVLPRVLPVVLSDYVSGIRPAIILCDAGIFSSLIFLCGTYLIAIQKQKVYLLVLGGGILLKLGFVLLTMRYGWGLAGVALASLVACAALLAIIARVSFASNWMLIKGLRHQVLKIIVLLCGVQGLCLFYVFARSMAWQNNYTRIAGWCFLVILGGFLIGGAMAGIKEFKIKKI